MTDGGGEIRFNYRVPLCTWRLTEADHITLVKRSMCHRNQPRKKMEFWNFQCTILGICVLSAKICSDAGSVVHRSIAGDLCEATRELMFNV